jgi:hypothetical protein
MIIHLNKGELPLIIDELFLSHAILRKNQQEKKSQLIYTNEVIQNIF